MATKLPLDLQHRLARKLLALAAEEFSNHGCNDFHLVKDAGLSLQEVKLVQSALVGDGEIPATGYIDDSALMSYLAENLGGEPT